MLPVVALPGLLCTGAVYDDVAARLAEPVETIELPIGAEFESIAERIAAALPQRCLLIGLSMGSYLCYRIACLVPHRIAGLVLISTTADADTAEAARMRPKVARWARDNGIDALARSVASTMLAEDNRGRSSLQAKIAAMACQVGVDTFGLHQTALAGRPDQRSLLPRIACPAIVMNGAHDTLTPPAAGRAAAEALGAGRFLEVPDAAHLAPLENPAFVAGQIAALATAIHRGAMVR